MDSCSNGPIIVPFVILRAGRPLYRDLSGLICHHLVLIIIRLLPSIHLAWLCYAANEGWEGVNGANFMRLRF